MLREMTYSPEEQLPQIPFDVADWGDLPDPWPGGLFADEAEREAAIAKSEFLPRTPPKPPSSAAATEPIEVSDVEPFFNGTEWVSGAGR